MENCLEGLPNGGSFNGYPLRGPPPNPLVGFYKWPLSDPRTFMLLWYPPIIIRYEPTSKLPYQKLQYLTYVEDIDPNVHIRVFKQAIKANKKIMEVDIFNMFGFTLKNNISEWGENFVQNHLNCTFEELEQAFCKRFHIVKNGEKIYVQLKNLKQQVSKWAEIYYECLLNFANCL